MNKARLTVKALGVILRLSNRKQLFELFPQESRDDDGNWCQARHSSCPETSHKYCTRKKGHDGPHIDYNLSSMTLIWLTPRGKLFTLNEGDDE